MRKSTILSIGLLAATIGGTVNAATSTVTTTWVKIAAENAAFTVKGTQRVRFGSGKSWIAKTTASGPCTAAFFGAPATASTARECQMFTLTTTQAAPAPAPAPTSYSVKLSWTIPTTRENGQPLALSELQGYEVYYAPDNSASTANDKVIPVTGGSINSSVITQLPAGTYYFSISAIDSNGLKSPLSTMVSAKVGS